MPTSRLDGTVATTTTQSPFPCPFVYSTGKRCKGRIVAIECFKPDYRWWWDGEYWRVEEGWRTRGPGSHLHLYCALKGNHAGFRPDALKYWANDLPELREILSTAIPADEEPSEVIARRNQPEVERDQSDVPVKISDQAGFKSWGDFTADDLRLRAEYLRGVPGGPAAMAKPTERLALGLTERGLGTVRELATLSEVDEGRAALHWVRGAPPRTA